MFIRVICGQSVLLLLSFGLELMSTRPEVTEYLVHLEKERDVSPHTLKAYARDLEDFTEFCDRHYGDWTWATVDRLGIRGFLGELKRRGLATQERGAGAVRGAELLPLSPGASRGGQQRRPRGQGAQAGEAAARPTWTGRRPGACSSGPSRGRAETNSGRPVTSPFWSSSTRPESGCRSSAGSTWRTSICCRTRSRCGGRAARSGSCRWARGRCSRCDAILTSGSP